MQVLRIFFAWNRSCMLLFGDNLPKQGMQFLGVPAPCLRLSRAHPLERPPRELIPCP